MATGKEKKIASTGNTGTINTMTADEIKALRKALGFNSSKAFADHLGVSHNTVRRWECGVRAARGITARFLQQLAKKAKRRPEPVPA